MSHLSRSTILVLTLLAAGCEKAPEAGKTDPHAAPGSAAPAAGKGKQAVPPAPAKREMPKFGPLTEEAARAVLKKELDSLGGDDLSRRTLLYLADLGDRSAVNAIHDKLLTQHEGQYEDPSGAAVGVEALLAYKEAAAGAMALKLAKQAIDEQTVDEYVVHMLARVEGAERAEAVSQLMKIAAGDDEFAAAAAVSALGAIAAPEAKDLLAKMSGDKALDGRIRGAAVAGLLHVGDARGPAAADALIQEAMTEQPAPPAGKPMAPPAEGADLHPEPEDVLGGLGVDGAVEAAPYVRKLMDLVIAQDAFAMIAAPEAASSLLRIFVKGGGTDLIPWLHQIAKNEEVDLEAESALALWALGDEGAAVDVATQLESMIAAYIPPQGTEPMIEILAAAARRGVAAKMPLRPAVESAAQMTSPPGTKDGSDLGLREMKVAAAHAFLKSSGK